MIENEKVWNKKVGRQNSVHVIQRTCSNCNTTHRQVVVDWEEDFFSCPDCPLIQRIKWNQDQLEYIGDKNKRVRVEKSKAWRLYKKAISRWKPYNKTRLVTIW